MFLAKKTIKKRLADGRVGVYTRYVLAKAIWDKEERRQKQKYVGYVGTKPVLTLAKAKEICKAKGLKLEDLKKVKGLRIK